MPQSPPIRCNRARSAARRQRDGGYLLLAIMLMMAVMIIAATIAAPRVVQQIKRDREEEMIHRGTEYARAIKKYYKKFGRYPANLEQLDNTNQVRFLRKHYKDPLSKDGKWKLLNYGDIQSLLSQNRPGTPAGALGSQGQSALGQPLGQPSGMAGNPQSQGLTVGGAVSQGYQVIDPSQQQQQLQPQQQPDQSGGGFAGAAGQANSPPPYRGPGGTSFSLGTNSAQPGGTASGQPGTTFGQNSAGGNQTFGGGAIVGVASVSKDPTIRIYNKKKTYDEWQFIYNPIMDQANVLLRGPYQPTTIGGSQIGVPAGQMNQQSPFGQQPGGFGQQQQQPQQNPQRAPGTQFPPDQNQQQ